MILFFHLRNLINHFTKKNTPHVFSSSQQPTKHKRAWITLSLLKASEPYRICTNVMVFFFKFVCITFNADSTTNRSKCQSKAIEYGVSARHHCSIFCYTWSIKWNKDWKGIPLYSFSPNCRTVDFGSARLRCAFPRIKYSSEKEVLTNNWFDFSVKVAYSRSSDGRTWIDFRAFCVVVLWVMSIGAFRDVCCFKGLSLIVLHWFCCYLMESQNKIIFSQKLHRPEFFYTLSTS